QYSGDDRLRMERTLIRALEVTSLPAPWRRSRFFFMRCRSLLLLPIVFFSACAPEAPVTRPEPRPIVTPRLSSSALVWSHRPRQWDRLLVGLTHLPEGPWLTVKPIGQGRLYDLSSGLLLARVRAGAALMVLPGEDARVRFATPGAAGRAPALRLDP